MGWRRKEILLATGGRLLRDGKSDRFGEVVTDSSKVKRGSVFVALKGERLDGHRFVRDAVRRGLCSCSSQSSSVSVWRRNSGQGARYFKSARRFGSLSTRDNCAESVSHYRIQRQNYHQGDGCGDSRRSIFG